MPLLQSLRYCAMLITDVVHKHDRWVVLLTASLFWKLLCFLLVLWKLVLGKGLFRSVLTHCTSNSCWHFFFSRKVLISEWAPIIVSYSQICKKKSHKMICAIAIKRKDRRCSQIQDPSVWGKLNSHILISVLSHSLFILSADAGRLLVEIFWPWFVTVSLLQLLNWQCN